MSTITVTTTSNDRDLMASFVRQQKALDKQIRTFEELVRKTKEADKAAQAAADKTAQAGMSMIAGITTVAGAWGLATAAINKYMEANRKSIEESDAAARTLDDQRRRSALLMKVRGDEATTANAAIEQVGVANAVNPKIAHQVAQQMAGSGFETGEITGGALDAFLKLRAATGEDPNSPESAAQLQALSRYFESQGIKKTGANVTQFGSKIQALMGPTDLSFENMGDLAKVASGFKGVLSPEEQLAAFSNLVGIMPGAEAGTKMADIVKNLRVAGSKKDATEQLGKIGLKPEDVDFVGENLGEVLGRMQGGLDKIPEKDRATVLAKVVEGANIATIEHMMTNRDKIYGLIPQMNNAEGFQADVALMQGGRGAAERRQAGEQLALDAARADNGTLIGEELSIASKRRGEPAVVRGLRGQAFDTARYLGLPAEYAGTISNLGLGAAAAAFNPMNPSNAYSAVTEARSGYRDSVAASEEVQKKLGEALDRNTEAVKENNREMRARENPGLGGQKEPGANE
jgi:hypothetical protein